jgi:hypothetical protein
MKTRPSFSNGLLPELEPARDALIAAAEKHAGDAASLLIILRFLEEIHQWLRDGAYMEALPDSRHELFELLNQMEQQNNWPNLPRTGLRSLISRLEQDLPEP